MRELTEEHKKALRDERSVRNWAENKILEEAFGVLREQWLEENPDLFMGRRKNTRKSFDLFEPILFFQGSEELGRWIKGVVVEVYVNDTNVLTALYRNIPTKNLYTSTFPSDAEFISEWDWKNDVLEEWQKPFIAAAC